MPVAFNQAILMGYLCADPELKYTPKGTAVCQFDIAVNHAWKNEAGEQKEETLFMQVQAWGRQGETIAQYLKKGSPLHVVGRLKLDKWEDKTSKEMKYKTYVVLQSFQFIPSGRGSGEGGERETKQQPRRESKPEPSEPDMPPEEQDDVPF
jgi:single-strand DNA-binding protein